MRRGIILKEKEMPKCQNIIKLITIFLICNVILACGNNKEKTTEDKWAFITKEIKVTLSSDNPDSVKIYKIKKGESRFNNINQYY